MALLLIRHGETDLNAARVVQFPETPLGENGIRQAAQLAQGLSGRPLDMVLTSDYERARMTAGAVASAAGITLCESPALRERNFGELRGQAYDDLTHVDIFGPEYAPPGGESWPVFHARVDRAWAEILELSGKLAGDLAVVTHGLVLRSLLERVLDVGGHEISPDLVVANTSVTEVAGEPPWSVLRLADTSHLSEDAHQGGAV
jgi:broad specificity phosphatase PhoE